LLLLSTGAGDGIGVLAAGLGGGMTNGPLVPHPATRARMLLRISIERMIYKLGRITSRC